LPRNFRLTSDLGCSDCRNSDRLPAIMKRLSSSSCSRSTGVHCKKKQSKISCDNFCYRSAVLESVVTHTQTKYSRTFYRYNTRIFQHLLIFCVPTHPLEPRVSKVNNLFVSEENLAYLLFEVGGICHYPPRFPRTDFRRRCLAPLSSAVLVGRSSIGGQTAVNGINC